MWKWMTLLIVLAACAKANRPTPNPTVAPTPSPNEKPTACGDQEGCHALWYDVHGKGGNPPQAGDLKAINGAAGEVVASGKATQFVILKTYPTGGYVGCLETLADGGYNALVNAFSTFRLDDRTYFEPLLVRSCPSKE